MGFVYLLECVSDYDTSYKIGFTKNKNISKRISSLQTGNKDKIKCINMFETDHGRKLETYLHNHYNYCKLNGEWFNLNISDVSNFDKTCQNAEKNFNALIENPFFNK
jgi:cyclopropane fatty-acyl-phospholipid synthase-like methyltransferase